jgi:hypothetical protein
MSKSTLHEWLLEQIKVDEQVAAAEADEYADARRPSESRHQAAWPPSRVLTECWTKRRVIDLAIDAMIAARGSSRYLAAEDFMQTTLQLLSEPYTDRPGYREEWRP